MDSSLVDSPSAPPPIAVGQSFEAWIRVAQNGDDGAKNVVLQALGNYLWLLAECELPSELNAKIAPSDLVQETLLEAHREFAKFRGQSQLEILAWLRQILINNAGNARRRYMETGKRDIRKEIPLNQDLPGDGPSHDIPYADPSLSSLNAADENAQLLETAISQLSPDYQEVLRLRYQENLKFPQIAERIGRNLSAVQKLWARAIQKLQQLMKSPHAPD